MNYIVKKHEIFQNPQHLPLNQLNILVKKLQFDKCDKQSDVQKIPAIHKVFIDEERTFPRYVSTMQEEDSDEYVANAQKYIESLDFLLLCDYHQFWCYLICKPHVLAMIRSFISNATPSYNLKYVDKQSQDLHNVIQEKICTLLARIFTYKQSPVEYMEQATVLKYLEDSGFFNFMIVLKICTMYARKCPTLVQEICRVYFSPQRKMKWNAEIERFVKFAHAKLDMIGGHICGFAENARIVEVGLQTKPPHFDPEWYLLVITHFLEFITMFNGLLTSVKYAQAVALENGIAQQVIQVYEEVFPKIYKMMEYKRKLPYDWAGIKSKIFDFVARARWECVHCFHNCVTHATDEVITNQGELSKQEEKFETYLALFTSALEAELFIFDYHNTHPIDLQFQMIMNFYPDFDAMRTDYILESLSTLPKLEQILIKKVSYERRANPKAGRPLEAPNTNAHGDDAEQVDRAEQADDAVIDEAIRSVEDALPHLGDGFILQCLRYYDNDPIAVIDAILEENLPPSLSAMPTNTIRLPPEPEPEKPLVSHVGKKPQASDVKELLDDKSDLAEVKSFILKKPEYQYNMYDDDYDDREEYDPMPARVGKRAEVEDPYQYMNSRFEDYNIVSDPSSSEGEGEASASKGSKSATTSATNSGRRDFKPFCEDPAKLREQREMARKNFRGASRNVEGKPKGQGQDKDVLKNRDKKTVNKSSRGNHNRKRGAQWKQARGMF